MLQASPGASLSVAAFTPRPLQAAGSGITAAAQRACGGGSSSSCAGLASRAAALRAPAPGFSGAEPWVGAPAVAASGSWWVAACASAVTALAVAGGRRRQRRITLARTRLQAAFSVDAWRSGFFDVAEPTKEGFVILDEVADIPEDLVGSYYRTGPGKFTVEGTKVSHQLDGDGVMLGITFNGNGQVVIRHRLVQTQGLLRDKYGKKISQNGAYGTRADALPWDKKAAQLKNTANVGALWFEEKLMALWPYGKPFLLDPGCLGTLLGSEESGASDLGGVLKDEETGFAASPRMCAATGNLVNFDSTPSNFGTKLQFFEFLAGGAWKAKYKICRNAGADGYTTFFDFAVTPKWFIVASPPVKVDSLGATFGKTQMEVLEYDGSGTGKFYFVSREKGPEAKEVSFPGDSVIIKEFANAYELDGGRVVIDAVVTEAWPTAQVSGDTPLWETEDPAAASLCKLVRYEVDLNSQSWKKSTLCERHVGFTSVSPASCGLQHRSIYCAVPHDASGAAGPMAGVARVDVESGEVDSWVPGSEEFGAAPLFIPKEGGSSADDGYLLNVLLDAAAKKSSMAIFDAKNISQGPLTRFDLPTAVPHGQKACWAPGLTFLPDEIKRKFVLLRMFEKKTQTWNAPVTGFSTLAGSMFFARQGGKMR